MTCWEITLIHLPLHTSGSCLSWKEPRCLPTAKQYTMQSIHIHTLAHYTRTHTNTRTHPTNTHHTTHPPPHHPPPHTPTPTHPHTPTHTHTHTHTHILQFF